MLDGEDFQIESRYRDLETIRNDYKITENFNKKTFAQAFGDPESLNNLADVIKIDNKISRKALYDALFS